MIINTNTYSIKYLLSAEHLPVVCAKHWYFWYVLGTGTSGYILLGTTHAQLALTDSSIQSTVSLITLSVTLPLATGTIYMLSTCVSINNGNRYRHTYAQLTGYIPITAGLGHPKRLVYAIVT